MGVRSMRYWGFALGIAATLSPMVPALASADVVETKGAFLELLLQTAAVKPDKTGKSPYVDVPTKSVLWGYVHKAIELGLAKSDTAKRFGANDPLTASQAAEIAAKLYHVTLGGTTPLGWAQEQGLLSTGGVLSASQATAFVSNMKRLAEALAAFPGSWTLPPAKREELSEAIQASTSAPYLQMQLSESESFKIELSPALQNKPGAQSQLQTLLNQMSSQFTISAEQMHVGSHLYSVAQATVHTAAGSHSLQEVFDDGVDYLQEDGSSWTNTTQADASLEQSLLQWKGLLTQVTWAGTSNGLDVFRGQLNTNSPAMASALRSVGAVAPGENVSQLLKSIKGTVSVFVDPSNGSPRIAQIQELCSMALSGSSLTQTFGADAQKSIQALQVQVVTKANYQYQTLVPTLPAGLNLANWPSSPGSQGNSTSSNSTGNSTGASTGNATGNSVSGGTGNAPGNATANGTNSTGSSTGNTTANATATGNATGN